MSYCEENGQVILTMSREDYDRMLMLLGHATGFNMRAVDPPFTLSAILEFMNRLNQGNPNYTPYQVEEKK